MFRRQRFGRIISALKNIEWQRAVLWIGIGLIADPDSDSAI
jgi:hypothetical protein